MKDDFFTYQAQTTPHPLALEISHAKGSYIYDTDGNKHLDFVAGVSGIAILASLRLLKSKLTGIRT